MLVSDMYQFEITCCQLSDGQWVTVSLCGIMPEKSMLSALICKVIIAPDGGVEICWRYRDELLGENQTAAW